MATSANEASHLSAGDDELAARFHETGDRDCIAELYRRFGHLVLGLSLKYLRQREDAEDAVAGIFVKLLDDLRRHRVTHFRSWLYVYSKNYCLMELRRQAARLRRELDLKQALVIDMESGSDPHPNDKERQEQLVHDALDELGEAQQTCVRLFFLKNLSYAEIAKITGYSANEVKSHLQNGRRNLKIKLENRIDERK